MLFGHSADDAIDDVDDIDDDDGVSMLRGHESSFGRRNCLRTL